MYKTPEITQPPTSTEVSRNKATSPERYITPDGDVKYVTEEKEDKDTPIWLVVLLTLLGVAVLFIIVKLVTKKKN